MKRLIVLLFWMASTSCLIWGQNEDSLPNIDSLLAAAKAKPDTTVIIQLLDLGEKIQVSDIATAKGIYRTVNELSEKINFSMGRIKFAAYSAHLFTIEGKLDSALLLNQQALEIAHEVGYEDRIYKQLGNIGNVYLRKQLYQSALDHFLQVVPYFERINDKRNLAIVHNSIQLLNNSMQQYERGIVHGEQALALMNDKPDEDIRGGILHNLSNNYFKTRQQKKAFDCLNEALRIAKLNNNIYMQGLITSNFGFFYLAMHDYQSMETYYREALRLNEELGNMEEISVCMLGLAYAETYKGNYTKAEVWNQKALTLARENQFIDTERRSYLLFAELSLLIDKDYEANQTWEFKADSVGQLILNDQLYRATEEANIKYETEKKELQIAEQEAVISRQKAIRTTLVGGLALSAVILLLLFYLQRLRNERIHVLTEMNGTKDRFFNIISHDLRNPAVAQRNALQTLLEHSDTWDADKLKMFYAQLLNSANSEVELLNNLLNWGRVQTNRMPYQPDTFELSPALTNEITLIGNMASSKGVALEVTIPDGTLVTADSNMLSTILRNLLTNAVKFTAAGGKVSLTCEASGDKQIISVSDTGQGMTPKQLSDLFRIDKRIATGTSGEQGTGVGLIVCKELLEKHDSTLHVESKEGQGSRFWFEI